MTARVFRNDEAPWLAASAFRSTDGDIIALVPRLLLQVPPMNGGRCTLFASVTPSGVGRAHAFDDSCEFLLCPTMGKAAPEASDAQAVAWTWGASLDASDGWSQSTEVHVMTMPGVGLGWSLFARPGLLNGVSDPGTVITVHVALVVDDVPAAAGNIDPRCTMPPFEVVWNAYADTDNYFPRPTRQPFAGPRRWQSKLLDLTFGARGAAASLATWIVDGGPWRASGEWGFGNGAWYAPVPATSPQLLWTHSAIVDAGANHIVTCGQPFVSQGEANYGAFGEAAGSVGAADGATGLFRAALSSTGLDGDRLFARWRVYWP